jgi:hypothetical protein
MRREAAQRAVGLRCRNDPVGQRCAQREAEHSETAHLQEIPAGAVIVERRHFGQYTPRSIRQPPFAEIAKA